MADIEKVIKGIDICLQRFRCGEDCPYYNTEKIGCMEQLREDALVLLKEQEAVEPYVTGRGETFETVETWWYACGNCHEALDVNDKYCRHCGRPVKWE